MPLGPLPRIRHCTVFFLNKASCAMTHTHATPLYVLDRTSLTNQLVEVGWEFTVYFFFKIPPHI